MSNGFDDFVPVPVDGTWLVVNGRLIPVYNLNLIHTDNDYFFYRAWVEQEDIEEDY